MPISTHADREGVDILFTVFVCTVTDFSGQDKASGVKFCRVVQGRPGQGICHCGNFAPSEAKLRRIGHPTHPEVKFRVGRACVIECLSISRGVWT